MAILCLISRVHFASFVIMLPKLLNTVLHIHRLFLMYHNQHRGWRTWHFHNLSYFPHWCPLHSITNFQSINNVLCVGLWPVACRGCGFETRRRYGCLLCVLCVLVRGRCDELITRPEESYPRWCVVVCDLETSWMRQPWTSLGRSATR